MVDKFLGLVYNGRKCSEVLMKKIFSIILCAIVIMMTGCSDTSQDKRYSYYRSVTLSERETSLKEAEASREAEIEEVDEWGISLDNVDRLAKEAIRKYEMKSEYRSDYNKIIREVDSLLDDIKDSGAAEYDLNNLLKKHSEACTAGIKYIESYAGGDVKWQYDLCMTDDQLDKTDKDLIRTILTLWNSSIQEIQQSETDMKSLLEPIISENRKLTDDEIKKVEDIYQILIDNVFKIN